MGGSTTAAGVHLPLRVEAGSLAFWDNRCAQPARPYNASRAITAGSA